MKRKEFTYEGVSMAMFIVKDESELKQAEAIDTLEDHDDTQVMMDATIDGLLMNFDAIEPDILREWTDNHYGTCLSFYQAEDDGTHYAILSNR
jgi:hypothetical protein